MHEIIEAKELDKVKTQLSKILKLSLDIVCVINEFGEFITVSDAAFQIWGYRPEKLIGETYLKYVYEKDRELTKRATFNIMNGVGCTDFENRYICKEGTLVSMIWTAQWDDEEKVMYCIARESTEKFQVERSNLIQELKANEIKLRTATAIARLGYWQVNLDGTNRFWSDEVYTIWGIQKDSFSILGDSLLNTIYPEDREFFETNQVVSFKGKKEIDVKYRIVCPDGAIKWVHELGKPVRNKQGHASVIQGTVQDVTAQMLLASSLEESIQRYKYVTQATSDGIWDWDIVGNTLYRGEAYKDITGKLVHTCKFDINKWKKTLHPEDIGRIKKSLYEMFDSSESIWNQEYRIAKTDGSYAFVVDRAFVIRNKKGKAIRMVGAMQDISVRKKAEAELKLFTDDLYKRNKELLQFGYVVSHNLRSPVANIMGITTLLELDKNDPDIVDKCIKDLKSSVKSLDSVILDLSEILSVTDGSAELRIEDINLIELLDSIKTDLGETIIHQGVKIIYPNQPHKHYSHKAYLYSVFYNLISNAIKYKSARQPVIKINIKTNANFLTINVSDNGIGIDLDKHKDELFKPYKRFNSTVEGKGLGLFLVKSHIEALKGVILIESTPGKGTTFIIKLPLKGTD